VRCDYAHDDGAYVLGALSPSERSAYERHLSTCPACREAVAEIAVLPGLLGRLDSSTALQLLGGDGPTESVERATAPVPSAGRAPDGDAQVVSLVAAAAQRRRKERRGQRLRYAGSALAAACLALVVALGVGVLRDTGGTVRPEGPTGPRLEAMIPASVAGERITALIGLVARSWGTEVTMNCSYDEAPTGGHGTGAWQVHLFAYGPDDQKDQIGSWTAAPGKSVKFTGATRFTGNQLVRLELQNAAGRTLLTYDVA
jgi:hypothetical protein